MDTSKFDRSSCVIALQLKNMAAMLSTFAVLKLATGADCKALHS